MEEDETQYLDKFNYFETIIREQNKGRPLLFCKRAYRYLYVSLIGSMDAAGTGTLFRQDDDVNVVTTKPFFFSW